MMESIEIKAFGELSLMDLYRAMVLRNDVFVVGQKITAEAEVDGLDPMCEHVFFWRGDRLIGTTRIRVDKKPLKVERVCIARDLQGQGLGTKLMEAVQERLGDEAALLHAQAHLENWYRRLGWERVGDVFDEAGIPHVKMRRGTRAD